MLLSLCLSLASVLSAQQGVARGIDSRIENREPTNSLARFVGFPAGAKEDKYVLNADFWAKDVDFSCVSPWNSHSGLFRAGTLISKRHIIFAKHYPISIGSRIVFVGQDGGVCPCYLKETRTIGRSDVMIGLLDAEVTPNIKPAKILPLDAEKYIGDASWLPVATFNQKKELLVLDLFPIPTNGAPTKGIAARTSTKAQRRKFEKKIIMGDSGNPTFFILGDQPVLLYCLKGGGCGCGPGIHLYQREIQAAMDQLCPGYKLEIADLSSL